MQAFGAVEVLADRQCITGRNQQIHSSCGSERGAPSGCLSPAFLLDCDKKDGACGGGFLDTAWEFLRAPCMRLHVPSHPSPRLRCSTRHARAAQCTDVCARHARAGTTGAPVESCVPYPYKTTSGKVRRAYCG